MLLATGAIAGALLGARVAFAARLRPYVRVRGADDAPGSLLRPSIRQAEEAGLLAPGVPEDAPSQGPRAA